MKTQEERYSIHFAADHGMDGYIVESNKGLYHLKHPDEIALIKVLFEGEKTIGFIYDDYIKKSTAIYGSYYGHMVDFLKDKPLFKLLIELVDNYEKKRNATVKITRCGGTKILIDDFLQTIDSANNEMEYAAGLTKMLQYPYLPYHLSLFYTGLGDKAAKAINELLLASEKKSNINSNLFFQNKFQPITGINLTKNYITSVGCEALSSGLSEAKSLKYLSLRDNPIGDKGLIAIVNACSNAHSIITVLDVIDCNLTDACMQHLVPFLNNNTKLEFLRLSGNAITDKGIEVIFEALSKHPSLKEINLYRTQVTDGMQKQLHAILPHKNVSMNLPGF